jgi:hypothetical protein
MPAQTPEQIAAAAAAAADPTQTAGTDPTQPATTAPEIGENELSSTHLDRITNEQGPLMQRVGARAAAQGESRGMMNSSITAGNAQGMMIDAATPLALQDAGVYAKAAEREDNQAWNTSEREDTQGWQTGERESAQEWTTGERVDTQDYNAWQNGLNRDWTSGENNKTNSLAWAQSQLDSATRFGLSKNQAFADMYSSIMNNPNEKFSAAERRAAVDVMIDALNANMSGGSGVPAASVYDPNNPWASYPGAQLYGSTMGPTYGQTSANLPNV